MRAFLAVLAIAASVAVACSNEDLQAIQSLAEDIGSQCPSDKKCESSCKDAMHKVYDVTDSQLQCIRDIRSGKVKEGVSELTIRVIKDGPKMVQK